MLDRHWNQKAAEWGYRPLFPILCDDCGEMFYFDESYPRSEVTK